MKFAKDPSFINVEADCAERREEELVASLDEGFFYNWNSLMFSHQMIWETHCRKQDLNPSGSM